MTIDTKSVTLRKAVIADVERIQTIVNDMAAEGTMLALSLSEIFEHIRDFTVAEEEGELLGSCALHVIWEDLAEIRSLAVQPKRRLAGIGRLLVENGLEEARRLQVNRVFALTYQPDFFGKIGFRVVDKKELPHKVWRYCLKCTKFPNCDETAVLKDLSE